MLEGPDLETHHHHRTGHGRLDLILAALAIFLSCVSVYIAVRHGETMERLVAANTWPNLTFFTSNENADGTIARISLDLKNTGVGPARIESLELFYKGVPMANLLQFHLACCAPDQSKRGAYTTSTALGYVLSAREQISLLALRRDQNTPLLWDTLNRERKIVRVRACYCSVFEECWVMDSDRRRPDRVKECAPSQPIQWEQ